MKNTKLERGGTAEITLDQLPFGSENQEDMQGPAGDPPVPDGVSQRMLARDVMLLAWPSLLELVLTQLTSVADQIMVGRIPGEMGVVALAAVGLSYQPKFLLMTAIQALNVGATAVIARCRGRQDREKANLVFRHAMLINICLSVIVMIAGLFGADWMVRFMGTNISEETIRLGTQYLMIQFYGIIPLCLTFTITAALRGTGDSRTPMIYNTVANAVNLVLNYILIYGKLGAPAMGVAGASLATIIGQAVAFLIALWVVAGKRSYVYVSVKEKFTFDTAIISNMIRVGVPAMVEQLLMRAGIIIYSRTVAGLGDLKFATHQILMSIQSFSFMLGQAFSGSATTLVGQSLGKRRYDMAVIYLKHTKRLGRIAALVLMVLIVVLRRALMGLFTTDAQVIAIGSEIMFLIALSQPVQADQFIISGGLRGAGDTKTTAVITLVTVLGFRSLIAILLINVLDLGLWGAWIALVVDQVIRTVLVALRFRSGAWKRIKLRESGVSQ